MVPTTPTTTTSGPLAIPYVHSTISGSINTADSAVAESIASLGSSPTQQQLLSVQMQMQTWTLLVQFAATMQKEVADALKGIVQKI
jgi:type III secretion protein F